MGWWVCLWCVVCAVGDCLVQCRGGAGAAVWSDGLGGAASLCARSRGEPSSAHCEQRLSDGSPLARAIPCVPAPECGDTREKETAGKRLTKKQQKAGETMHPTSERQPAFVVCAPTRSAASRAVMAGWAGEGGGRFGERREYEAPTLPSTPRQHGMARHQTRQPRNNTPCQHGTDRHNTRQPRNSTPPQQRQQTTTTARTASTSPPPIALRTTTPALGRTAADS